MQDVWGVRFWFLWKASMCLEVQLKENYLNWAVFDLAGKKNAGQTTWWVMWEVNCWEGAGSVDSQILVKWNPWWLKHFLCYQQYSSCDAKLWLLMKTSTYTLICQHNKRQIRCFIVCCSVILIQFKSHMGKHEQTVQLPKIWQRQHLIIMIIMIIINLNVNKKDHWNYYELSRLETLQDKQTLTTWILLREVIMRISKFTARTQSCVDCASRLFLPIFIFLKWHPLVVVAINTAAKEEVRQDSIKTQKVCIGRRTDTHIYLSNLGA